MICAEDREVCAECNIYEPDAQNPAGGLGDCQVNRDNPREIAIQHKAETHYHQKLIYPNLTGCSEWKSK